MSDTTFDPVAFISDMHDIGAALEPYTNQDGVRVFRISGPAGIMGEVVDVAHKHEAAALAHPGWTAAVHDALIARWGGL